MGEKSMSTLRTRVRSIARSLIIASALVALTTCDLFKAGLGSKIDISAPTVDVDSLKNGDYISSARTLSGTVGDDVRVTGVSVSVYTGSTLVAQLPASISGSQWSVVLDPAALFPNDEVQADLNIRVSDDSGKTTDRRLVLYFDTVRPTVSSLNPSVENLAKVDSYLSEVTAFEGSVKDGFGVETVSFVAGGVELWDASRGTSGWTVYCDTTSFAAGSGGVTDVGGGVLQVPFVVSAVDKAGNASVPVTGHFFVDQTRSAPWISEPVLGFFTKPYSGGSTTILAPEEQVKIKISDAECIDADSIVVRISDPSGQITTPFTYSIANGNMTLTRLQEDGSRLLKAEVAITLPSLASLAPKGLGEYAFAMDVSDDVAYKVSLPSKPAVVAQRSYSNISLTISNAIPTITVTSPANGAIVHDLSVEGTIVDGIGVQSVSVGIDGAAGVPATLLPPGGAGVLSSTWSYYSNTLSEGTHTIDLYGFNVGGKQSALTQRQIVIDRTAPTIEILSVAPATTAASLRPSPFADVESAGDPGGIYNRINGIARIRLSATDQNPLQSVTWTLTSLDGSVTYVSATPVDSWVVDINTTASGLALVDGTKYRLALTATDRAGNSTTLERTLLVSQAGDEPAFLLKNMSATATTPALAYLNLMLSNPRIDASVTDDDWVDSASIEILVDQDPTDPSPTWISLVGTRLSDGSVSVGHSFSALGNGRHRLYLRASDTDVDGSNGRKAGLSPVSSVIGPVYFAIDLDPPVIAFAGAMEGLYVSSTKVLTGTVSSDVALDIALPLTFLFNGVTSAVGSLDPAASIPGSHDWTFSLDVSGVPDGTRNLIATARDEFGVTSSRTIAITVDKTEPELVATNESQYFSDLSGLALVGTIRDVTSGIASLTATVMLGAVDVTAQAPLTLNAAAGTPNTLSNWSLDLSALATGTYSVSLRAEDKAGNIRNIGPLSIIVDKDLPVATIDQVLGAPVAGAIYNAASVMPANWTGSVSDSFFESADLAIDGTTVATLSAGAWSRPINWGSVAEGSHTLTLTARDLGGHVTVTSASFVKDTIAPTISINKPDPGDWVGGATYTARGAADDGAGLGIDQVRVIVDTASVNHSTDDPSSWTPADGGASWSLELNLATLGEGPKRIWVASRDRAGNWNTSYDWVAFGVDQNPPNLTVYSPAGISSVLNATSGATFNGFEGYAWDSNSLASLTVTYTKSGGSTTTATISVSDSSHSAPGNAWVWSPFTHGASSRSPDVVGHSDDGSYTFVFTAFDVAGKQVSSAMYSLTVDTTIPTIDASYPASGASINGLATIRGSSWDNSQVVSVQYSLDGGTNWIAATGDVYNWAFSFDTRSSAQGGNPGLNQGSFSLRIRSEDASGNYSVVEVLPLVLDQSTDYPVVTLTNMDQSRTTIAGADANLQESNAKVQGSISDDDWIDVSSIQYSIDGGPYNPVSTVSASSTIVTFEQSLTSLPDGPHYIRIRVSDTNDGAANRKGGLPSVTTVTETIYFAVDKTNPVVVISAPASPYTTGPVSLSGTVTDGNNSSHVQVSIDGGLNYSASGVVFTAGAGERPWSWNGSLAAAPEGPFTVKVKGIDQYGKESVADVVLTVDRTGPVMSIGSPASGATVNGPVSLSGISVESYGMDYVQVAIMPLGNSPASGDWTNATGTFAWTYNFESSSMSDGDYTVFVRGFDQAGNVSAVSATRNITINQASDRPMIDLATLSAGGSYVQNLLPGSMQISGTASDDDAVARLSIQIRVDANDDGDFDDGVINGISENWVNVTAQPSSDSNIVTWSHAFDVDTDGPGPITGLVDGRYRLEIRVADVNFAAAHPGYAANADWTSYSDPNKWRTSGVVRFSVDSAPPTGSVTSPSQGSYLRDPGTGLIRIEGTASDGSGIQGVQIKVGAASPVSVVDDGGATPFSAWHYDYPIASQGQVSYQIIITDNYNKITTIDRYFVVDNVAPEPAFIQPTSGSVSNGIVTIRGSCSDTFQVSRVYLWIGPHGASSPGNPESGDWTDWIPLDGTYNWQYVLDTRTLTDGSYDARVRALDGAGNLSGEVELSGFNVLQSANYPIITISNLNEAPAINLFGVGGTISGTVTDDDGVSASTLEISFQDGASGTWLPITNHGPDGYSVAWSFAIPAGIVDSPTYYSVKVRARDIGQTVGAITVPPVTSETASYRVALDRADPALSVNSIRLVDRYTSDSIVVSGAAMSGARLFNSFTLWIDASSDASSSEHPLSILVSVNGAPAQAATYSAADGVWTYPVPISVDTHADDGNMTLAITAIDTWNRQSSVSLSVVIDTMEPAVAITQPTPGSSVNGTVYLTGTTFEGGGISSLTIRGGIVSAFSPVTFVNTGTNQAWAAQFEATDYDNASCASITGIPFSSINAATDTITTTADHGFAEGDVVYFYGTPLPSGLTALTPYYVMPGASGSDFRVSAVRGGTTAVDIGGSWSGAYVRMDGIVWRFPIEVTAIDNAGNRTIVSQDIYLDRNGDKPRIVDATLMPADGASVSGAIVLQSTVTDDDAPAYVRIFADLDDDGTIGEGAYPSDLNSDTDFDDPFEREDAYLQVNAVNGVWSAIVNNSNEFSKTSLAARGIAGASGWIRFHVVPYDINGTAGNVSIRRVYVDSSAPAFGGLNYTSGALVRGGIVLSGYVEDDADLAVGDIRISYDGGASFQQLGGLSGSSTVGGMRRRTFTQAIDTTGIQSDIMYVILKATDATYKQNQVNLNFSVDNRSPSVAWNVPATLVPISGTVGSGTETYGFSGSGGSSARAFGRAIDEGAISGIAYVDVYFVKNGVLLDPKTGVGIPGPTPTSVAGDELRDQSGTIRTGIPYTTDAYGPGGTGTHYAIRVNKRTELGQFDLNGSLGDGDGFNESLQAKTGSPNYDEWYSYFDSTILPDGPLDVYYVAYDEAGNKSYGSASAQVMNNPPTILGFADNAVPAIDYPVAADGRIKAKVAGSFRFDIRATDSGAGSGLGLNWGERRLTVAERYGANAIGGDINLSDPKPLVPWYYGQGGLREFDSTSGSTLPATATIEIQTQSDGFVEGDWYRLVAQVRDDDGNIASRDVWLRINNADAENPILSFDAGNLTRDGSVGFWTAGQGPLQATIASANVSISSPGVFSYALPSWIGNGTKVAFAGTNAPGGFTAGTVYYVVGKTSTTFQLAATQGGPGLAVTSRTGSYNLVSGGRAEAAGDSSYSGRPAVSGSVRIYGNVYDNTDVTSLTISIDGGPAQALTLTGKTGDVLSGYTYTWSYLWDSSTVANAAKANVQITVHAQDAAGNGSDITANVDVMPYVTAIVDSSGLSSDVLRGATGKYSISAATGETLTVRGYNFGSGILAYVSPTAAAPTAGTSYATTRDASYPLNMATVSKNIGRSGYLTMYQPTGTVPSLNNLNRDLDATNAVIRAYNMESTSDPRTAKWTDDRYLWTWAATQVNISSYNGPGSITDYYYPDMVMNGDQPEFSFTDESVGNVNYTTSDTAATKRTGFRLNRYATMAAATVGGTWQRFILTSYDSTYGLNNTGTGHLEVTGFGDQGNNQLMSNTYSPSSGPDDGGTLRWNTIQGNDYYNGTQTNNTYRKWDRYPYPKMIAATSTVGTGADIYVAYYDSSPYRTVFKNLNFVSFRMTGARAGNLSYSTQDYNRSSDVVSIPGTDNGKSSQWFDMARVGSNGIAIAYYDPSTTSLRLAYSADAYATTTNQTTHNKTNLSATWTVIPIDGPAGVAAGVTGSTAGDIGKYVSITAGGGKLYMAYYDFDDASLKIARADWNGSGAPSNISSVYVDKYLSAGTWTNIEMVTNANLTGQSSAQPFISYYSDSYNGTKKPIRLAFPRFDASTGDLESGTEADGEDEEYSGSWEVITVPAISAPRGGSEKFQKTQLGAYSSGTLPVVGWVGDRPEYAKLRSNN